MTPSIKFALPCFLLIFIVGRSKAFDFEPRGGWGPLWLNQTEPDGEIDQLGDLTVRRSDLRDLHFRLLSLTGFFLCHAMSGHIEHSKNVEVNLLLRYGPASNSKWVLWGHDIFGPLSGANMIVWMYPTDYLATFSSNVLRAVENDHSSSRWFLGRTMEYCAKMNQDLGVSSDYLYLIKLRLMTVAAMICWQLAIYKVTCILPDFFRGADPWVPGDPLPSTWAQMGLNHLITGISSPSPSPPSSPSPSPSSSPPPSLRRPGMDWEEKLVPYLNEGGATSVAVVGDQITIFSPTFYSKKCTHQPLFWFSILTFHQLRQ